MDILFAQENLAEMLSFLEELGEKEVLVVYTSHKKGFTKPKTSMKLKTAFLVKNAKEAQKYASSYDCLIGVATRDILESKLVTHVYGAEELSEKDKTHFRAGGLNQVLAKIIAEKKKTYVFSLASLLGSAQKELILGRMHFNKVLLEKYSVSMLCASMAKTRLGLRAPRERKLFLEDL